MDLQNYFAYFDRGVSFSLNVLSGCNNSNKDRRTDLEGSAYELIPTKLDLANEKRDVTGIREVTLKARVATRYNKRVLP